MVVSGVACFGGNPLTFIPDSNIPRKHIPELRKRTKMFIFYLSLLSSDSDREFITCLYQKLNKRLLGYAYHLSGDVQWAQDATQQVFLAAMDKIQILTQMNDDEMAAYCFTIVRNSFTRRNKRNSREHSMDIQEIDVEDTINGTVEDAVLRQLEYAEVKAAVQQLSEPHRMIIALRFGLNRTHAEIAQEMGISVSSSQNLLATAIRQLRKLLEVNKRHEE